MTKLELILMFCTFFCLCYCVGDFVSGKLGRAYYELKKTLKLESLEGEDDE